MPEKPNPGETVPALEGTDSLNLAVAQSLEEASTVVSEMRHDLAQELMKAPTAVGDELMGMVVVLDELRNNLETATNILREPINVRPTVKRDRKLVAETLRELVPVLERRHVQAAAWLRERCRDLDVGEDSAVEAVVRARRAVDR